MTTTPGFEPGNNDVPPASVKSTKNPTPWFAAAGLMPVLALVALPVGIMLDSLPLIFVSVASSVLFVPTLAVALILLVKSSSR